MRQKLFLVLVGFLISLFMIEAFLRLTGYLYYKQWMKREYNSLSRREEEGKFSRVLPEQNVPGKNTGLVKIICLGDSWTFGAGASPGYSYPAQLQIILNKETPNRYKVYNLGIPGCTSQELIRYLPKILERYEPNIVMILLGKNDLCNPQPSELNLLSKGLRRYYYQLENFIVGLRIYKVLRFSFDELRQKVIKVIRKPKSDIKIKTRSIYEQESGEYTQKAHNLFNAGKIELAKDYFERALDMNPANEEALLCLGHLYQMTKEFDKALITFKRLLSLNPYTFYRGELYRFLFHIYQHPDSPRDKIEELIKDIPSDESFRNPGMPFILNQKRIIKNLEYNLEKIIDLIRAYKAILIFQIYRDPGLQNDVLRSLSERYALPLVDNEISFNRLSDITSYFHSDGHPNEKGYHLIAENIYAVLKKINK